MHLLIAAKKFESHMSYELAVITEYFSLIFKINMRSFLPRNIISTYKRYQYRLIISLHNMMKFFYGEKILYLN